MSGVPVEGLVSTIIPVHNRPALLREAVESVLAQTHRPIEIIVSDDGSTDETPEVARSLCRDHPEIVRYVRQEKSGAGPAREAGRAVARGEFIQYLDSDDLLLPAKFEVQVEALRGRTDAGVAYGITRLADLDGRVLEEPFKWTGRPMDRLFPALLVDRWWCTHTPLYRRSVCDRVGPWSDLRYSQDWEYDARVGGLCVELVHCDAPVSVHRVHGQARQTGHGDWLGTADRVRFFRVLLSEARRAGVTTGSPQMRHFSRWMFFHARECGALGDAPSARACHELAIQAAGGETSWDIRVYGWIASLAGWTAAGRSATTLGRLRAGRPGQDTLRQSWMPS